MRKLSLFAIIALAIGITVFHSCKKDDELTNSENKTSETSTFNPNAIENMDEYLLGFMKKISSATRDNETMTIEDAEWHLTACLNFQFCNANVEKTQVVYDTIFTTINVSNGYISFNDINTSLQEISTEVFNIYTSSNLENKNVLFIQPEIQDEASTRSGNVVRTVVATSGREGVIGNHYFDDDDIPLSLFPEDAEYSWRTTAIDTLAYFINIFEPTKVDVPDRIYYVEILSRTCKWNNGFSGRMFYFECSYGYDYKLNQQQMAYYLDSYLGLIDSLCPMQLTYMNSNIVPWGGTAPYDPNYKYHNYIHHVLNINYGYEYHTAVPPIIEQL